MLIKHQYLSSFLQKQSNSQKSACLYILIGQDSFLLNECAEQIKLEWRRSNAQLGEEISFTLAAVTDWINLENEINNYSLFSTTKLIDTYFDKKTIDINIKELFTRYVVNKQVCWLLVRAPNLPSNSLQWLITNDSVCVVQVSSLKGLQMQDWISTELSKKAVKYEIGVPALIYYYTQGNMFACAQVIEKIDLYAGINHDRYLTLELVKEQLVEQVSFQLFELSDACLNTDPSKAIQLLRYFANNKTEATLVLWALTKEVRILIQLISHKKRNNSLVSLFDKLKIWQSKIFAYKSASERLSLDNLLELLACLRIVDSQIKANNNLQIWNILEQIVMSLCIGKNLISFI